MIEQWMGEIIGKMHVNGISKKDLAKELGYTPEYTGKVLKGKCNPKQAETKIRSALAEIIAERE